MADIDIGAQLGIEFGVTATATQIVSASAKLEASASAVARANQIMMAGAVLAVESDSFPYANRIHNIADAAYLQAVVRISVRFASVVYAKAKLSATFGLQCEARALYLFTDPLTPGILRDAGEQVLYPAASGLEKAMATTDAYRLTATYAELIQDQWDPYAISARNLPYLAWAMGVNLWEDIWSDGLKRQWTADQWRYKSVRGSERAFRWSLGLSNYTVTDIVRPPQGFYASPDYSKEEEDAWIRQMPELRVTRAKREGTRGVDEFFAEDDPVVGEEQTANVGFADQDAAGLDDGEVLWGRYAFIRHNGIDTPVYYVVPHLGLETRIGVEFIRYSTVGDGDDSWFADDGFSDDAIVDADIVEPKLYSISLDRAYSHDASTLSLTTVMPDLDPITPRYERNSDIGDAGPWIFADDAFCFDTFVDHEDGGDKLFADRVYLNDPSVSMMMMRGLSFSDWSRVGIPDYYAELQVELNMKEKAPAFFCEDGFSDEDFVVPEDPTDMDRAIRAVVDAKALRDTIALSFASVRPAEMGDYITVDTKYAEWVRNLL